MNLAALTDITGFYCFHHYLLDSEGRVLVNCWLAIERLHSLTNDERALYLEDMLDTYLVSVRDEDLIEQTAKA